MTRSEPAWVLYTDGGSRGNPGPAGSGFVLRDPTGALVSVAGHFIGVATNNQAEYDGLIRGIEHALSRGCKRLEVRTDSQLVVRQMTGRYRVKNEGLKGLYARARTLAAGLEHVRFVHVPREENAEADAAANSAMDVQGYVGNDTRPRDGQNDALTLF